MDTLEKTISRLGLLLIIIAVVFIFTDVKLLVTYWEKLSSYDSYKMVGSGVPQKYFLLFDTFRWLLLLIGGIGFVRKNVLGWIFPQAFVLLTFCGLTASLVTQFCHYEVITWIFLRPVIIISSMMIFVFNVLNLNIMKEYLSFDKYQKIWLWSSVFILNAIGLLIFAA
ncbi:hypothetical protein [Flavobacterium sp. LC2016-01]|uniref:hypothetical protein n=1 Tax=Flavobacterium sp. LC2016-01 TaxID=2675876 RepID=UPI0012BB1B62|nr:hypothetical protein [Flavobacterium sp. LC2016-01]MTH14323.1 hypothetical protein [Flavobacterium sp. LC2016-01]